MKQATCGNLADARAVSISISGDHVPVNNYSSMCPCNLIHVTRRPFHLALPSFH